MLSWLTCKVQRTKKKTYIKKEWKIRNIYIFYKTGGKHFYIYGCQIYDLAAPVSSYIDVSIVMTDFMPWFCFISRIHKTFYTVAIFGFM